MGGEWSAARTISVPGGPESYGATVEADARGDAVVALAGYERHGIAMVAALDGAGRVLAKLAVPSRAKVGTPVRLSVSPFDVWAGLGGPPRWRFGDGGSGSGNAVTHVYRRAFTESG